MNTFNTKDIVRLKSVTFVEEKKNLDQLSHLRFNSKMEESRQKAVHQIYMRHHSVNLRAQIAKFEEAEVFITS